MRKGDWVQRPPTKEEVGDKIYVYATSDNGCHLANGEKIRRNWGQIVAWEQKPEPFEFYRSPVGWVSEKSPTLLDGDDDGDVLYFDGKMKIGHWSDVSGSKWRTIRGLE